MLSDRQTDTTKLIVVAPHDIVNTLQNGVTLFLFKVSRQTMASMRNSELVNTLRETGAVVERIIKFYFQKKDPTPPEHLRFRGWSFIKACLFVDDILR